MVWSALGSWGWGCYGSWVILGSMGSWNGCAGPIGRFGVLWDLGDLAAEALLEQGCKIQSAAGFEMLELMGLGHCGIWGAADDPGFGVLWDLGCCGIMRTVVLRIWGARARGGLAAPQIGPPKPPVSDWWAGGVAGSNRVAPPPAAIGCRPPALPTLFHE